MRRYSEAVKADVRRRMHPPYRQSVALISKGQGIHIATLYAWRKAWRFTGKWVVPASGKDPGGWSAADKFHVVLECAGLNTAKLGTFCRERVFYPVVRRRLGSRHGGQRPSVPVALDANAHPRLTMSAQGDLQKHHQEAQREIKRLQQVLTDGSASPPSGHKLEGTNLHAFTI